MAFEGLAVWRFLTADSGGGDTVREAGGRPHRRAAVDWVGREQNRVLRNIILEVVWAGSKGFPKAPEGNLRNSRAHPSCTHPASGFHNSTFLGGRVLHSTRDAAGCTFHP